MFFLLKTTYNDWANRISAEASARLATHGVAISHIHGEGSEAPRLIVNTENGHYVFIGDFDHQELPEAALVNLLKNSNIEMCAPVRVTALFLLRTLTD